MDLTRKLSGRWEGALAAGGDPATSPLYVFGPFMRLIVPAGVASITYGASIWLAVLTVATVSAMYRQVMRWVADGTGGSGLSEEEFGPAAGKLSAAITISEYTLTFLVSVSALVTFLADRIGELDRVVGPFPLRFWAAVALTVVTGVFVNRGPRIAALVFGPATAAVLLLLWGMMLAVVVRLGPVLPPLHLDAFAPHNLDITLGGFARILALMTGIEVFANLVAAYSGSAAQRSKMAFGSLVIVMGTTALAMLVLGPAIFQLTDPTREDVSVFTQMMDSVLPQPLAYAGTFVGVAVLLSACATAAQGIQNLGRGLTLRHYLPASFGRPNSAGVAAWPVWLLVAFCALALAGFGTREGIYLAVYAAGVFVLLSMTAWAALRRIARERGLANLRALGTGTAALLTSVATLVVFEERFLEGAWIYLVVLPILYAAMSLARRRRGAPSPVQDCLGRCVACSCGGLGAPSVEDTKPSRRALPS